MAAMEDVLDLYAEPYDQPRDRWSASPDFHCSLLCGVGGVHLQMRTPAASIAQTSSCAG